MLTDAYRAELAGGDARPESGATPAPSVAPGEADQQEAESHEDQLTLMTPKIEADTNGHRPPEKESFQRMMASNHSGEVCWSCGSADVVRAGTCLTCRTCGSTSGCG